MRRRGPVLSPDDSLELRERLDSRDGKLRRLLGQQAFETATRNTLDIAAVPLLKELTHLPVIVDPSHGTGRWSLVAATARAAVAAGADGVMVEVHPRPDEALSDGPQSLTPQNFAALVPGLAAVAQAVGRTLAPARTPGVAAAS